MQFHCSHGELQIHLPWQFQFQVLCHSCWVGGLGMTQIKPWVGTGHTNALTLSPARGLRLSPARDKTYLSQGIRRKGSTERKAQKGTRAAPQEPSPSQSEPTTSQPSRLGTPPVTRTHSLLGHCSTGRPQRYFPGTWLAKVRSFGLSKPHTSGQPSRHGPGVVCMPFVHAHSLTHAHTHTRAHSLAFAHSNAH